MSTHVAPRAPALPSKLLQQWHVFQVLGTGAFSTVYRATRRDQPGGASYALKVARDPPKTQRPRTGPRPRRHGAMPLTPTLALELEEASLLQFQYWPGIVRMERGSFARQGKVAWLALEQLQPLPPTLCPEDAVAVALQVQDTLQVVHELRRVHCDVACGNILVVPRQGKNTPLKVKLADLGAMTFQDTVWQGAKRGTLPYMSREVMREGAYYVTDDLESLTFVVIQLVTGTLPWLHLHDEDLVLQAKQRMITEALDERIPPPIQQWCVHIWRLPRKERPPYETLRHYLQPLGAAQTTTIGVRGRRTPQQRPRKAHPPTHTPTRPSTQQRKRPHTTTHQAKRQRLSCGASAAYSPCGPRIPSGSRIPSGPGLSGLA